MNRTFGGASVFECLKMKIYKNDISRSRS